MKKTFFFLILLVLTTLFYSCSTKVDLYAEYKDIPVIYGLLDVTQDTNYVKIVRAFSGSNEASINANEVALIADSCNYPGKLDAYICRYRNTYGYEYVFEDSIKLDTLTIHNKEEGVFYAPTQKVYFAKSDQSNWNTGFFKPNVGSKRYRYKLVVYKDNDTVTAETGLVGGEDFRLVTTSVTFVSTPNDKTGKISFKSADNGEVYDLSFQFNYSEKKQGVITDKYVKYSFGSHNLDEYEYDEGIYYTYYDQNLLFNLLASAIGTDTINVERYIGDFTITLAAGGEELYNYIQVNAPSGGFSQTIPDYTNINGGYGVFSSRMNLTNKVNLSAKTQTDLLGMPWGFRQRN